MAETNPFVLAFGWPQLTVDAVSVLFGSALRDCIPLNATKSLGLGPDPGMPVHHPNTGSGG
jgi:hypothetical protein